MPGPLTAAPKRRMKLRVVAPFLEPELDRDLFGHRTGADEELGALDQLASGIAELELDAFDVGALAREPPDQLAFVGAVPEEPEPGEDDDDDRQSPNQRVGQNRGQAPF